VDKFIIFWGGFLRILIT